MITTKKSRPVSFALIITVAGFVLLCAFVIFMLGNVAESSSEEALKAARDNIIRAAVSCYAIEGVYPESLQYLIDNYSLVVDLNRYNVHFERISDNLIPNIIVTHRRAQE
jgi:hypothetical protein